MSSLMRGARFIGSRRGLSSLSKQQIQPLETLLIANRGEIACRVIRTARKMGIKTVSVYSEPDVNSLHVQMADEAYCIGPASSTLSYLKQDHILDVAHRSGSHAIHPGYGFLSENAQFSFRCKQEGIIFLGPPESAITNMGIKSTAKEIMSKAGVPVVPGYHGVNQEESFLQQEADKVGFPLMIKAVKGGGGKGMRVSTNKHDFLDQLRSAKRESEKSFGDGSVLLERYIERPRHIEVQIFGDKYNNYVHLFERDCSVQRRHQKIIEEAPAPLISATERMQLGEAGVKAAAAVAYEGAGTVEFIYDMDDTKFYFMEMNTRLQVEHPITEMITGTDLVEWQIRVGRGEPLPKKQHEIGLNGQPHGHSFEGRIYAEDTTGGLFLPSPGSLDQFIPPIEREHVRVETGVQSGDEVQVHYDPMIAKIVVWDEDRDSALRKLRETLRSTQITGVKNNIDFLIGLTEEADFKKGHVYTGFIQDHMDSLFKFERQPVHQDIIGAAAFYLFIQLKHQYSSFLSGYRVAPQVMPIKESFTLNINGQCHQVIVQQEDGIITVSVDGNDLGQMNGDIDGYTLHLTNSRGEKRKFSMIPGSDGITLFTNGMQDAPNSITFSLKEPDFLKKNDPLEGASSGAIVSPMPGVIEHVLVKEGDVVKTGDPLVILIAMKMEYTLKATRDGVVQSLPVIVGQNVAKGATIIKIE